MTDATTTLDELYRAHRSHLVNYASRWTRNRYDAEDVVQEAFTIALVELDAVRPHSPVGWLFGITRRRALETARRSDRERPTEAIRDAPAPAAQEPTTDGWCMADPDTALYVLATLDELPPRQREALRLWAVDGLSWPEVADRMGITVDSARRTGYASLRKLRTA